MFYQTRRIVKNRKKIERGRSGLLLPQLQGAGCDTKNVGVSKDIWREREQINLPSESQPGFGAPPVLGGIPAPSLHSVTQSLSFLVCEMGTMRPPHNGWEDSVSKQGYKKLRGLIINTGIFALSEHI